MDMIIRIVNPYGFLPLLVDASGEEKYRGEFQHTPEEALLKCRRMLERIEGE